MNPMEFKFGHHKGVEVRRFGTNLIEIDWGPPKQCMCRNHPGPIAYRAEDGNYWAIAANHKWYGEECVMTFDLNKGHLLEVTKSNWHDLESMESL